MIPMNILIINAGSSSLKYQLMNPDTGVVSAKGLCERIGIDGRLNHTKAGCDKVVKEIPMPTHSEAIAATLEILQDAEVGVIKSVAEIDAVGHRVLHGGMEFFDSCVINDEVIAAIKKCIPLGPLHNPANLMGIEACQAVMPKTPQVAVFDTAFHMTMPAKAYRYAIPTEYYKNDSIRRYGFHGTSHKYVARRTAELVGKTEFKMVNCHLGNGSSMSAIKDGKCQDTTMGLTPLAGVPMGTRSGDIDAAVVQFLCNKYGYSVDECLNILNKKSGMLAISGVSSDFRDLEDGAKNGNEDCALARDKFAYEVAKYVGAYAAALNGIDVLTFTAGVGENDCNIRAAVCEYLGFLGVKIDPELNSKRGKEMVISTPDSKVQVWVVPTNEELMIAKDTADLVKG
jgi:acetate kinase